jgi:hypothetical protein
MSADNGYMSGDNLEALDGSPVDVYIATDKGEKKHKIPLEELERPLVTALTHDFLAYDKSGTYSISEKNISQIVVDRGKSRWHD